MKRAFALFVAVIMVVICCACKNNDEKQTSSKNSNGGNNNASSSSSPEEFGGSDTSSTDLYNGGYSDSTDSFDTTNTTSTVNTVDSDNVTGDNYAADTGDDTGADTGTASSTDSKGNKGSKGTTDSKPTTRTVSPAEDASVTINGEGYQASIPVEGFSYPKIVPEYNTAPATTKTSWDADTTMKKGGADAQADALREKIVNSKNTLDIYDITGTVYYVSPNGDDSNSGKSPDKAVKTLDADIFTLGIAKAGDAVLFERNGVWRTTNAFRCNDGITYGSYGKGEKPAFLGSARNYADKNYWTPSNRENVWKITIVDNDVGLVVCNDGELVGVKKLNGIVTLENNGDFYFNTRQDTMYFYCDKGNPGKIYDDIEIGVKKSVFKVSAVQGVTLDNLRIKYCGLMAVDMADCDDSAVTNCEIGFIGGCIQSGTTRLGNGIQVWDGVNNHKVENCWIYQVYDAGISWQGDNTYVPGFSLSKHNLSWWQTKGRNSNVEYKNISYKNNLIEYCTYSIEFWHGADTHYSGGTWVEDTPTKWSVRVENFDVIGNICRFAGFGWGRQRPDHMGNHICVWRRPLKNAKNNKIVNNIFDMADSYVVYWQFVDSEENKAKAPDKWDIRDNTYYLGMNKSQEGINYPSMKKLTTKEALLTDLKVFDDNPTLVWMDE